MDILKKIEGKNVKVTPPLPLEHATPNMKSLKNTSLKFMSHLFVSGELSDKVVNKENNYQSDFLSLLSIHFQNIWF